ncbi:MULTISPECIES: sigma-70 family RNA polymerase sigma factor [Pseudoxanthomonas]|uniref:RNA polymerase sigma factor for flagellar operon FliA n=1 Tax=Pseudoxanthomonas winnipegensis TaxID=2480810 RepID=A0AAW8GFU9_9GAMM|nr:MULTISPECIES: sigma-70 family RNA polymerase sigma factor [Pseudoxanthomonas]MDQ1120657.1 RNA polymerase sigma factor for flagellar operon FliA [Pseudoxanthomonas winnipegensis]MDQ1133881.1 RNA polymerase sigma factor for flagellar operon FliA [Pseudoxanthomonas winnipegensis]MDR6139883.1 RNA polymerase sigma factor for flagellar operon FliA [Pseudoxanthomonas sp. SORGH_AS_0997]
MDDDERELWLRYRASPSGDLRDALFLRHMGWARSLASSVFARLRYVDVDWQDYVQNANLGLLESIGKYEPTRGVPFQAFALRRVRGAVFNGLRASLRAPVAPSREVPQASAPEGLVTGFEPGDDDLSVLERQIAYLAIGYILEHDIALRDAERSQVGDVLREVLTGIPERQREIVVKHYFLGIKFHVIADELGLTKGRVSQLHKSAMENLRSLLTARRYEYRDLSV